MCIVKELLIFIHPIFLLVYFPDGLFLSLSLCLCLSLSYFCQPKHIHVFDELLLQDVEPCADNEADLLHHLRDRVRDTGPPPAVAAQQLCQQLVGVGHGNCIRW